MSGLSFYHEIDESAVSSGSEQQSLLHCTFASYPKMCSRLFASTVLYDSDSGITFGTIYWYHIWNHLLASHLESVTGITFGIIYWHHIWYHLLFGLIYHYMFAIDINMDD